MQFDSFIQRNIILNNDLLQKNGRLKIQNAKLVLKPTNGLFSSNQFNDELLKTSKFGQKQVCFDIISDPKILAVLK
jgi:hypothetical protein